MFAKTFALAFACSIVPLSGAAAIQDDSPTKSMPIVHATDFENGAKEWMFLDKDWKVTQRQLPASKNDIM